MSKLHVKQIEGYLSEKAKTAVDMSDCAHHTNEEQVRKAFLTRALATLSVSHLAEVPLHELGPYVTDGSKDGGIDLIYFDSKERTLYLVQTKRHDDGRGSLQLADALKFVAGVRKVLDNDLEALNERIKARKADIERALFDANARFVLVLAHMRKVRHVVRVTTQLAVRLAQLELELGGRNLGAHVPVRFADVPVDLDDDEIALLEAMTATGRYGPTAAEALRFILFA